METSRAVYTNAALLHPTYLPYPFGSLMLSLLGWRCHVMSCHGLGLFLDLIRFDSISVSSAYRCFCSLRSICRAEVGSLGWRQGPLVFLDVLSSVLRLSSGLASLVRTQDD